MINMFPTQTPINDTTKDDTSVLMTPLEMAAYLGIGRNMAYQLLNNGTIKGFRIGTQWKVSKLAVDHYILQNSGFKN